MTRIPSVTTEQMREVDRLMIEEYGIGLPQMMENAGRNLARLTSSLAGGARGKSILILAGKGNNGGGGMVAARHLANMGGRVRVALAGRLGDLQGVPARQALTLSAMGVVTLESERIRESDFRALFADADIVVDAIIGYSLKGPPRGIAAALIGAANEGGNPVLSLDMPSGVDAGSGRIHEPAVRAAATVTLALPKRGMAAPGAKEHLGRLYLADISVPPALYSRIGLEVGPIFADDDLVELRWDGAGWTARHR